MDAIFDVFTKNPMLLVAVIVFLICVVIGFFGDRYLRSKNKIGRILDNNKEEKAEAVIKEPKKEAELVETNPTLITSENINDVNIGSQSADSVIETSIQSPIVNDSMISSSVNPFAVDNPAPLSNDATMSQENVFAPNPPTDILNNVVTNPTDSQSQEISEPILPEYPVENNPQDTLGNPVQFDGQIVSDENINNIF